MTEYDITVHRGQTEAQVTIKNAAKIARVTESFIFRCEKEEIVTTRHMQCGEAGLCFSDIRRLKLVRHLHEDLGFKLENIEFVLRLRERLHHQYFREKKLIEMHHKRERELLTEIEALRRRLGESA